MKTRKIILMFTFIFISLKSNSYEPKFVSTSCPNGASFSSSNIDVVLHTQKMAGHFTFMQRSALHRAMNDIHTRIEGIAGVDIKINSFTFSTSPYVHQDWYGNTSSTLHVGIVNNGDVNASGTTLSSVSGASFGPRSGCHYDEVHIYVKNRYTIFDWFFSTPEYSPVAEDYFDAGLRYYNGSGEVRYFRLTYIHELMHALGFEHNPSAFSQLNTGDRPWGNKTKNEMIFPLADDIEGLRAKYPDQTKGTEVALLTSWYDPNDISTSGAATQKFICKPAVGSNTSWSANFYDTYCSTDSLPYLACPGDNLLTRVAITNLGTDHLSVDYSAYFSEYPDDNLDGSDLLATRMHTFTLNENQSSLQGRQFKVPTNVKYNTYYRVIASVEASEINDGGIARNWIPLRGYIYIKDQSLCQ